MYNMCNPRKILGIDGGDIMAIMDGRCMEFSFNQ